MRSSILFFVASAMFFSSCGTIKIMRSFGSERVSTTAFKVEIPFVYPKNDRMFIPVFFEKENVQRTLLFDSHAPMSVVASITKNNPAFSKIGKFFLPKPTPDGKTIPNIYYQTDGIRLGNVRFDKVMINGVADKTDTLSYKYDGIFGTNLLEKGVWKIDFERHIITMASAIDSIDGVNDAQKLPVKFSGPTKIKMDFVLPNNVKATYALDLGYGGMASLKKKLLDKVDPEKKAKVGNGKVISAAGVQKTSIYDLENQQVKVGDKDFILNFRSTDVTTLNLLGLQFFAQFKFVIFDYLNKAVYVSNEKMPTK
jgi:hypothetical protein